MALRCEICARSLPSSFWRSMTKFMSAWEAEKACPAGELPAFMIGGRGRCRGFGSLQSALPLKKRPSRSNGSVSLQRRFTSESHSSA